MFNTFNDQFSKSLAILAAASFFIFTVANAEYCDQGTYSANEPVQIIEYLKTLSNNQLESFKDKEGNTAIHLSLKYNENNLAEEIFAKHPNLISIENSNHESPIDIANKYRNINGIKLCLEYVANRNKINNFSQIFQKVSGTEPYRLSKDIVRFYQSQGEENKDKLVIILNLLDYSEMPDGSFYESYYPPNSLYFINSEVPVLVIGNRHHSLSHQLIKESIEQHIKKLPEKILLIIDGHGNIGQEGDHEIDFDNTNYKYKTKDLFMILNSIFKDKPIEVFLTACHGGGAIKDVNLLP